MGSCWFHFDTRTLVQFYYDCHMYGMDVVPVSRPMRLVLVAGLAVLLALGSALVLYARSSDGGSAPALFVALGASDSVGVGATLPESEGWVPRVHAALPAGTRLLNLGISGATMGDIATQQVPPAMDVRPQLVTLWGGVNDLVRQVPLATFSTQLDDVLGQIRAASGPRATIIMLNLPNLHHVPAFDGIDPALLDQTIRVWNATIAEVTARHNVTLVDLYAEWPELADHPEYISADGFHPSALGYERIAALVIRTIEQHATSS